MSNQICIYTFFKNYKMFSHNSLAEKLESTFNKLIHKRDEMNKYDSQHCIPFEYGNYISSIILSLKNILIKLNIPEID